MTAAGPGEPRPAELLDAKHDDPDPTGPFIDFEPEGTAGPGEPRSNEEGLSALERVARADDDTDVLGLIAEVRRLRVEREALARVRALADVVAQLQPADPDTHDRDVSWLALLEAIEGDV